MTRILVLASAVFVLLTSPAWAIEDGLSSVVVTPAGEPDIGDGISHLESLPGFQEAVWDTARKAWVVSVEDSVKFEPRELVAGLAELDVEVETLRLEFRAAYAKVMPDEVRGQQGFILSPINDMKFVVLFNVHSKRLWYFLGISVQGPNAPLKLWCDVYFGASDSTGAFAPDTVDVVKFELAEQWD
jgi:hypothetical protein